MFGVSKKNDYRNEDNFFKKLKNSYIVVAVAYVVFGMSLAIKPELSSTVICFAVGALCLIYSITALIKYFTDGRRNYYIEPNFILPVVMAIFGFVIIVRPSIIVSILPVIVGIVLIISGIMKLQDSFNLKKYAYKKWFVVLIFSIVSIVLGVVVILNPFGTGLLFIRIVGIFFTVDGLLSITSGVMLRSNSRY